MQAIEKESAYLTYAEAARYCSVHSTTIWRAVKRNELKAAGPGRAVRFHVDELDAWMNKRDKEKAAGSDSDGHDAKGSSVFAPDEEYHEGQAEPLMFLFRILSRRSWDELQSWHRAFPNSRIEHLLSGTGIYVLIIEPGRERVS